MALELVNKLPYDHPYRWDGREFGGVKLWRPDELGADLALWLDAEDTDSITLNGTNVSAWGDKSGNGFTCSNANAATQPAYTAGAVTFDGVDEVLLAGSSILTGDHTQALTMFSVSSLVASESGYLYGAVDTTGTAFYQNGTTLGLADTLTGANANQKTHGISLPGMGIVGVVHDNSTTNYSFNGTITNADFAYNYGAPTVVFTLGNRQNGTNVATYWEGSHHEVVVTNTALSTEDRQKVEGYFAHKWDLTDKLPSDHPYKLIPPYVGIPIYDADAQAYFNRVEGPTGDNQTLEASVKTAINNFIVGCKADGIWNAIKSSAILAGARTLSGALQPLVGTAPTNFNFVSGDYNRKTGLVGDGSTKYLNSNRNNNADPQDSKHISVYVQQASNLQSSYIAGNTNTWIARDSSALYSRINQASSIVQSGLQSETGFIAANRPSSTIIQTISGGALPVSHSASSTAPANENLFIFQKGDNTQRANARLSFYSIGESLDLAALDTRVSALMTALDGAIA